MRRVELGVGWLDEALGCAFALRLAFELVCLELEDGGWLDRPPKG